MPAAVDIVTVCRRRAERGPVRAPRRRRRLGSPDVRPRRPFCGHRGVAEFFRRWLGTWEGYEFELEELHQCGDGRVVTLFTERGRAAGSGAPVEIHPLGIWTVEGGKVVAYRGSWTATRACATRTSACGPLAAR